MQGHDDLVHIITHHINFMKLQLVLSLLYVRVHLCKLYNNYCVDHDVINHIIV